MQVPCAQRPAMLEVDEVSRAEEAMLPVGPGARAPRRTPAHAQPVGESVILDQGVVVGFITGASVNLELGIDAVYDVDAPDLADERLLVGELHRVARVV